MSDCYYDNKGLFGLGGWEWIIIIVLIVIIFCPGIFGTGPKVGYVDKCCP